MRKMTGGIFLFFLLLSFALAFAHPPNDIIFKYDKKSKIFSVGVAHSVKNPAKHFIKEIDIKVNRKEWISQKFTSQANSEVQAASYAQADLKKGDVVEVLAVCSEKGELKKTFKIE